MAAENNIKRKQLSIYKDESLERRRKRRIVWTLAQEEALIEQWEERIEDFRSEKKKTHIHEEIAIMISTDSHKVSGFEVGVKLHNLIKKYRHEKTKIASSGGCRSQWSHFAKVHRILANYAPCDVDVVIEESTAEIDFKPETSSSFFGSDSAAETAENSESSRPEKKRNIHHQEILEEIRRANNIAAEELQQIKKIEEQKVQILQQIAEENSKFHENLLNLLRKK